MPAEITILGTASMVPTKERNVQGIYLEYEGIGILFDCGEGTQRQMNIAGINRNKIKHILISHWHGDHVGGLIGMLQTIGNQLGQKLEDEYADHEPSEVHIWGPRGTGEHLQHLLLATVAEHGKIKLKVHELPMERHTFFEQEEFELQCAPLRHSTLVLGYAFVEKEKRKIDMRRAATHGLKGGPKIGRLQRGETVSHDGKEITPDMVSTVVAGKKFVLIADTMPCNEAVHLAENADLLVCESTFDNALEEKAHKFKHMTAEQAGSLAQQAGAKRLILTHFSQRYAHVDRLTEEARLLFPHAEAAFDFMKLKL